MKTYIDNLARDRRSTLRHNVKTALRIRVWKSEIPEYRAESVNISQRGIFFSTKHALNEGEIVEVFLKMPQEVSGEETTEWRCTGHVVRTEKDESLKDKMRVGVQFYCYEVSRTEQRSLDKGTGPLWRAMPPAERRRAMLDTPLRGVEAILKHERRQVV
jgi:c-di-GMP-binding flagellar brake protein YcgR